MAIVTSVKYLIGFVVAGTAAIMLGGSAFAAQTTPLVHDHETAFVEDTGAHSSETVEQEADTPPAETLGSDVINPEGDSQQIVGTSETTANTADTTSLVTNTNTLGNSEGGVSSAGTVLAATSSSIGNATVSEKHVVETESVSPGNRVSIDSPNPVRTAPLFEGAEQLLSSQQGTLETKTQSEPTVSETSVPTVAFGEQRLPIQPVITARAAMPADLASTVPSAPASGTVPSPTHSTGLLSALGTGLVANLVAHISLPDYTATQALPLAQSANLIVIGSLGLMILVFGSWLRRGGFATAPRSDVASHQLTFAPSLLVGYVSALLNRHNPFSVVMADTKTLSVMFVTL